MFNILVLQRRAKKCTKIYNARAQLLFCSLNFLFSDVLLAVFVVVCSLRAGSHFDISISISRHTQKQYDADN